MKKIYLFLISFFIAPLSIFAANYKITDYYFDTKINSDGSADVKQMIVMDGSFNGYQLYIGYRNSLLEPWTPGDIDFSNSSIYNASSISDVRVSAKYVSDVSFDTLDDDDFDLFENVDYANNGDKGKVISSLYQDELYLKMFYSTRNRKTAFLIEYTLNDVVVIHNDVAEFYWQYISQSEQDKLRNVNVRVTLPYSDSSDYMRVWAHGSLDGEVERIGSSNSYDGLLSKAPEIISGDGLDVRMTFDKSLITNNETLNKSEMDAFDEILAVEKQRADEANKERRKAKIIYNIFKVLSYFNLAAIIVSLLAYKFTIGKKKHVDFDMKYNREFIDDYNVEVIDYLMNKSLTPNAMSASIMNLIYKKKISVEEINVEKNAGKKKKDFEFTLINEDDLSDAELKLVNFLFRTVGSDNKFDTVGLKKYAGSGKTGASFSNSYTSWTKKVIDNAKCQLFFEDKKLFYRIFGVLTAILLINLYASAALGVSYILIGLNILICLIVWIYLGVSKAYTEKGTLHLKKWLAFKNFLKDFGSFKEKDLPEIVLWERYLVYAVIFGLADKVQKEMNVKIQEMNIDTQSTTTLNTYTNLYLYDSINSSFTRAVTEGRRTYSSYVASSGSGHGGGFSSGGGFGGGGGSHGGGF